MRLVSPTHFIYNFSRKIFLTLQSINWPIFIACLPLLLEILGNMNIVIICCPVCDVINFAINPRFLIKPFFNMTKKSGPKCKYLKNERNFQHEIKSIFHHFKRAFIETNKKTLVKIRNSKKMHCPPLNQCFTLLV